MSIVTDYMLGRQLNHDHDVHTNLLYLKKAGDTATGVIFFPANDVQGNAFISSINAGTNQIDAIRIGVTDAGDYFSSTDVEGVLQEVGASIGGLSDDLRYRNSMMLGGM